MDFLKLLGAVKAPTGLWAKLINAMEGGIANYAVVLILVTLIIKVALLPFDFYNKYVSKKNMSMQAVLAPELAKINKKYANNPNLKNQKTAELYKKHNYSLYGTCFGMLGFMIINMVVFFTLFSTLNGMSAYKIKNEYDTLSDTYNTTYVAYIDSYETDKLTNTNIAELTAEEYATNRAESAVVKKYGEIKNDFLWIKNIWRPDTWAKVTLSYKDFISTTKYTDTEVTKADYEKVMNPIQAEYSGWNGYLLLAVINGLLSLGGMLVSEEISKKRAKKRGEIHIKSTNKGMMIAMPIIMAIFTIMYNAAFGIYIVTGSLFTMITSPLVTLVIEKIAEKQADKKKNANKASYSR